MLTKYLSFRKFRRVSEAHLCEKGHQGLYNFCCSSCDYKTHKKHHLERHMKSHLQRTPFFCPICGFKSGRKDNLKQHVEKRHCSNDVNLQQLESLYPSMFKDQEAIMTLERAVEFCKTGAPDKLLEERKQIQSYSVEERLLDQRSIERLNIDRLIGEKKDQGVG